MAEQLTGEPQNQKALVQIPTTVACLLQRN